MEPINTGDYILATNNNKIITLKKPTGHKQH